MPARPRLAARFRYLHDLQWIPSKLCKLLSANFGFEQALEPKWQRFIVSSNVGPSRLSGSTWKNPQKWGEHHFEHFPYGAQPFVSKHLENAIKFPQWTGRFFDISIVF